MTAASTPAVDAFVQRTRERRNARGIPSEADHGALYRVLDGVLARHRQEVPADATAA